MKNYFLPFLLILLFSCNDKEDPQPISNLHFEPLSKGEIVKHHYYTLSYSEENEQAYWVYYELTKELIDGTQSRTDDFKADPMVSTGSASLNDYKGSGYDRGHLCPAADMTINLTAMSESFYLSNMSPQLAGFNRGIWSTLESQVRAWTLNDSKLYVVTGPIFKDNLGKIGNANVTVPGYYYKVLFDGQKMIGMILPNASTSKPLDQFVVTVDEIEKQTGIDFFSELDDPTENRLESEIQTKNWNFN